MYKGPVRFAEKISRNIVPADLLWEKNTVPAKKTNWKRRIIREANRAKNETIEKMIICHFDWICIYPYYINICINDPIIIKSVNDLFGRAPSALDFLWEWFSKRSDYVVENDSLCFFRSIIHRKRLCLCGAQEANFLCSE